MNLISLILSIIAITLSLIQCTTITYHISENMINIIGITTTLIVGLNIYDAITVKELDKKQKHLDTKLATLQKISYQNLISTKISFGISVLYIQPYTAFRFFYKAFEISIENNDIEYVEKSLSLMIQIPQVLKYLNLIHNDYSLNNKNFINEINFDKISEYRFFYLFEKRINEILSTIKNIN